MLNFLVEDKNRNYYPKDDYQYIKTNAGCSRIYKKDNILKIYHNYIPDRLRITEDIFKVLKDIDYSNFVKLVDYYKNIKMIAYTTKVIEHNGDLNILNLDKELIKYNLIELKKLILLFTKLNIAIEDVHYRNYLLNKDVLVLIDPDCYRFIYEDDKKRDLTKDTLMEYNYIKLLNSFKSLYIKSFYNNFNDYQMGTEEFARMIDNIFSYDDINEVCKKIDDIKLVKR